MQFANSSARAIVATVCLLTGAIGVMLASKYAQMMIQQTNEHQADPTLEFFLTPMGRWRVFEDYRRLCPDGRLHVSAMLSAGLAIIALFVGFYVLAGSMR